MSRVLIIGCGDIAMRVAPLLARHDRMFGLVRRPERYAELRAAGITPIPGDLDDRRSLTRLAGLADTVLHFAPPPNTGPEDGHTRVLLAALARGELPKRLVYISTSGVYGDCYGARGDETRRLHPQTDRAVRRADAERQIRAWAMRHGVRAIILRVPGIYAAERLPLGRLHAGTVAIDPAEDSYTNHIHADDLALIVLAALRQGRPNRVYNASDDSDMKMGDYFDAVAGAFALPRPARLPRKEVELVVPAALWSFMNESRRMDNIRMKRELNVELRYPTVADFLDSLG